MRMVMLLGFMAILANVTVGGAAQDAPPGMTRYQVALLKAGPSWNAAAGEARKKLMGEHLAYRGLVVAGRLVAVGPTAG